MEAKGPSVLRYAKRVVVLLFSFGAPLLPVIDRQRRYTHPTTAPAVVPSIGGDKSGNLDIITYLFNSKIREKQNRTVLGLSQETRYKNTAVIFVFIRVDAVSLGHRPLVR